MLWQGFLVVKAFRKIQQGGASGLGFVVGGWVEFLSIVLLVGWGLASLWYLLRKLS
jgi:hypothetical protein